LNLKRCVFFAVALLTAGCAPDPMIGSYTFTITQGLDTQTAPNSTTSTPTGLGTLVITQGKTDAYLVTIAHADVGGCTLRGAKKKDPQAMTFDLVANQPCVLKNSSTQVNASITTGAVNLTITQVSQSEQRKDVSMAIQYSYSGTTFLGINFAGTGTRTYAGPEL
jgi:hypothetical protein